MDPAAPRRAALDHPLLHMPGIDLPAGTQDANVTRWDEDIAGQLLDLDWRRTLQIAREHLRRARRTQRRAAGRPAIQARRRDRELREARNALILAAVICQIAERSRADLTITSLQVARSRERAEEQMNTEPGRFAVTVENWIHNLAGEPRLART